jgi:TPR repeat protein
MRLRGSLAWVVVPVAVGGLAGWFALDAYRASPAGRQERSSVQVKEVARKPLEAPVKPAPAASRSPAARLPIPPASLPPLETPVREVVAALKARADGGDVRASCRIGMELARCRTTRLFGTLQAQDERRLKALKPGSNEFMAVRDSIEAQRKAHAVERLACEGVEDPDLDAAWSYLLRAAQGGHVPSISLFLVAPPLPESAIEDLEGYAAYRDHAPAFFERAIAAGDVPAAFIAYSQWAYGRGTRGGKVFERDPQRALTFAYLLLPLVDARAADTMRFDMKVFEAEPGVHAVVARREADRLRQVSFSRAAPIDASTSLGMPRPSSCAE